MGDCSSDISRNSDFSKLLQSEFPTSKDRSEKFSLVVNSPDFVRLFGRHASCDFTVDQADLS